MTRTLNRSLSFHYILRKITTNLKKKKKSLKAYVLMGGYSLLVLLHPGI